MRKYMESSFYYIYLVAIIGIGLWLLVASKKRRHLTIFGIACIMLGAGDAFHLVPRSMGLFAGTLDAPDTHLALWLGVGKLVTSITMTVFYVLAYLFVYKRAGQKRPLYLDISVAVLFVARIVLCAMPQNQWTTNSSPISWGIYRNIPFVLLGILVIVLTIKYLRHVRPYRLLWLAIILSFGFYLPVVLWAGMHSWVGMLMLPKTICYLWIAAMGLVDLLRHGGDDIQAAKDN